jgi:comEA protein
MFNLTPQEKLIIIFLGAIALFGAAINYYQKSSFRQTLKLDKFIQENILRDGPLNINKATKDELIKISGIGEKTAQAIIDYRQNHGSFSSVDELKNIKNMNKSKFEKISKFLTIE